MITHLGYLRWTAVAVLILSPFAHGAGVTITPIPVGPAASTGSTPGDPTSTAPPTDTPVTVDEAKSLYDAGKYQDCLRVTTRLLETRGPNVVFNRQDILLLRAECQLEIHETSAALGSLETAASEAEKMGLTDNVLSDQALRLLIQRSTNSQYTPVTGPDHNPINILDRTKRKSAFDALYADDLTVVKARLTSATANQILPPLVDVGKELPNLRALEHASASGTTTSDNIAKESLKQASKIIYAALADYERKTTVISNAANRQIPDIGGSTVYAPHFRRQGFATDDLATLHDIMNNTTRIQNILTDFTKAFNGAEALAPVKSRTASVYERARSLTASDFRNP